MSSQGGYVLVKAVTASPNILVYTIDKNMVSTLQILGTIIPVTFDTNLLIVDFSTTATYTYNITYGYDLTGQGALSA